MEIKRFEKSHLVLLRKDIQKELESIGEKYGIVLNLGSIKFDDFSFSGKIEARIFRDAKEVEKEDRKEFEELCSIAGLKPSDYNRAFTSNGKVYRVCGISPRARKYPVVAVNDKGRKYKFEPSVVVFNAV